MVPQPRGVVYGPALMPGKILVTGATGFVGARLVKRLLADGHHVKAMVRASSSLRMLRDLPTDKLEIVEGDVMMVQTVFRALAGCDRLFHVATITKFWDKTPGLIEQTAVLGTTHVMEMAKKRGISRVVYTSSVGTLGALPSEGEMDETHELTLADPDEYIRGKKQAETLALSYASDDMDVVAVLPAAIFGQGDWKPTPGGKGMLEFIGWNVPLFDFPLLGGGVNGVDVDDVVEGHVLAMQKGRSGEKYILAGENVTYEQLFTMLAEVTGLPSPGGKIGKGTAELVGKLLELRARITGKEPDFTYREVRDFADAFSWVTSKKAETELGYTHRPLRRALARAVQWYLANGYVQPRDAARIRIDLRVPA